MASIRAGIGGGLCHLPQDLGRAWTAKPQRSQVPFCSGPSDHLTLQASKVGRCLRLLPACSPGTSRSAAGHAHNRLSQSILAPVFSLNLTGIQKVGRVASKYLQGLIQ